MNRESFILYNSFYEPIKELKNEQLGKLLRAIFNYTINGEITQENDIMIAFLFIKNQLDIDNQKWENIKKVRSEAGKKHKGNQYTNKMEQMEQNGTNGSVNENDNVNENGNVNVNVDDNDNIYDFVEKNFGRLLSPADYDKITEWKDNELTRYAIKKAVINNKCSTGYIDGILNGYKRNNIITVQQAQDEEEQFKKMQEQNRKFKGLSFKEQERLRHEEEIQKWLKGEE